MLIVSLLISIIDFTCFHVVLGLVYCMDYLEKNIDWLQSKLEPLVKGMSKNVIIQLIMLFSYV